MDETDDDTLWNDCEDDGSGCEEDEGTDCENRDSDTVNLLAPEFDI